MLKKVIAASAFLSLAAFNSYAASFEDALAMAYTNNPYLQSAREDLKATDESMPSAISGWLPTISASDQRGRRKTTEGAVKQDKVTDIKQISISQPLFKGGQTINSMKQAENTVFAARANLREAEQQVLLDAITAYMDIISDTEVLELSKNNVAVMVKHLDVTRERFDLGEVTKTDVAQAEASLADAQSQKINAEGALEISKATYIRVTGDKPGILEPMEDPVIISASLDEIIQMAMDENPSVQIAHYNKKSAKNSISIAKGKLLPSIDFTASKDKQQGALFATSDLEDDKFSVNLSVPLYQSGSEYSNIRKAKSTYRKYGNTLEDQKNKVREAVIKSYNDFQVARAIIESDKAAIGASEVALEGTQQEAQVGSRTTLDVLDAEQKLFEAKANLIRSKRDEVVNSYTLLSYVGRLNVKELGLKVDVYNPEKNYNKRKYQIIGF